MTRDIEIQTWAAGDETPRLLFLYGEAGEAQECCRCPAEVDPVGEADDGGRAFLFVLTRPARAGAVCDGCLTVREKHLWLAQRAQDLHEQIVRESAAGRDPWHNEQIKANAASIARLRDDLDRLDRAARCAFEGLPDDG